MAIAEKEWTVMFFFASDNPLAPEIVSQLKSIKQAGFHPEANVVAQFDPHNENQPTHIFDVNRINKLQAAARARNGNRGREGVHRIGFTGRVPDDPYVVNLMADKIWGDETDGNGELIRDRIQRVLAAHRIDHRQPDPPRPPTRAAYVACNVPEHAALFHAGSADRPDEPSPRESLRSFLKFCSDNYPARHYLLFILGHGVVVGHDIFLFDEHASQTSMTLVELGVELRAFKENIKRTNAAAEFEMVGFHSCSLSSLEVACELEGTANFMLASQGPAFVGSWPYRQILIRIFKDLTRGPNHFQDPANVKEMLKKIFAYCLYNSFDFIVAGYSYEVCLCNLNLVGGVKGPLSALAAALIEALRTASPLARERILLSHWDAQSYWKENYTDIFDFCFRLRRRCLRDETDETSGLLDPSLKDLFDRCADLLVVLEKETQTSGDRFIVRSEFAGTAVQYSNGISVYFPWSAPLKAGFLIEYQKYRLIKEPGGPTTWFDFLSDYFKLTRRSPRSVERPGAARAASLQSDLLEEFATSVFNVDGLLEKPGPGSPTGDDDCDNLSIKNYPLFTRVPRGEEILAGVAPQGRQVVSESFFADPPQADPASSDESPFLSEFV